MKAWNRKAAIPALALAIAALGAAGCKKEADADRAAARGAASAPASDTMEIRYQGGEQASATFAPVASNLVCMVNNQVFGSPQIPVEVDGKTYYGCCENCKEALMNDRRARMATDPVSGKEVDKALAVIGAHRDGQVQYFENEENLRIYAQRGG